MKSALVFVAALAAVSCSPQEANADALRAKVLEAIKATAQADAAMHGVQNCLQKCALAFVRGCIGTRQNKRRAHPTPQTNPNGN